MGSNEPVSSKQFLSKIEEGQAKMYYDIGKRVHSYFEDTFKEVKQYLQQFPPQNGGAFIEEAESNSQLPHNYELLQQEIQKLKSINVNQKAQIQKLKEENAQLLRKAAKPSSRKMKDKSELETDTLSNPDETEPKTRKTRTPKNTKSLETLTLEDSTRENQSEPWDHESLDQYNDQVSKDNKETSELDEP
ncbi:hypothetical protein [Paenibacillus odorifer]|uniref:hypothetical protein n=1 Tax=Paenibacillus TaxID=44249 RepID=UPI00096E1621|nr:hypothetical protein [Paenibacillus odorifer]OME55208.1 hypothetical protein BSK61_14200 [Paenibacillus odorifer]